MSGTCKIHKTWCQPGCKECSMHYGFNACHKCHMEDDRCDHKPVKPEEELIIKYIESMPRYSSYNSINRYSMFLLFQAALKMIQYPPDFSSFSPTQPKEWRI